MGVPVVRHTWTASDTGTLSSAGVDLRGWGTEVGVYVRTLASSAVVQILTDRTSTGPGHVLSTIAASSQATVYEQFTGPKLWVFPRVVDHTTTSTVTIEIVGF